MEACGVLNLPAAPALPKFGDGAGLLELTKDGDAPCAPKRLAPLPVLLLGVGAKVGGLKDELGDVAAKALVDPNGDVGLTAVVPKLGVDVPKVGAPVVGAPKF